MVGSNVTTYMGTVFKVSISKSPPSVILESTICNIGGDVVSVMVFAEVASSSAVA